MPAPVRSGTVIHRSLFAATLVLLLGGCAALQPAQSPIPADPAAEQRPDLIVAEPAVVSPGEVVALTFPAETNRGILFTLDQLVGENWVLRNYLTSDGPGAGWQVAWYPPNDAGFAVEDIGVGGPGPDHVPIPETAEPGDYRICIGNAGDDFCTPIEIVAP